MLRFQRVKPYRDPPVSLGDHLKKRRLGLGLRQKDAAAMMGINDWTYLLWEIDRSFPSVKMMPCIIEFVGCYPFKEPSTLADRLLQRRHYEGLTQHEMAQRLGIDEGTIRRAEREVQSLSSNTVETIERYLGVPWHTKNHVR